MSITMPKVPPPPPKEGPSKPLEKNPPKAQNTYQEDVHDISKQTAELTRRVLEQGAYMGSHAESMAKKPKGGLKTLFKNLQTYINEPGVRLDASQRSHLIDNAEHAFSRAMGKFGGVGKILMKWGLNPKARAAEQALKDLKRTISQKLEFPADRWGNKEINIGMRSESLGGFRTQLKSKGLEDFEWKKVKGDGNCWIRSLWQATLPQVLEDERAFGQFVKRVEDVPRTSTTEDILDILNTLKRLKPDERIHMLNHRNVDATINRFTRKLVAERLLQDPSRDRTAVSNYTSQLLDERAYGGAEEINEFANYFGLTIPEVTKKSDGTAQVNLYGSTVEQRQKLQTDPHYLADRFKVLMFGANPMHYEVLDILKHPKA